MSARPGSDPGSTFKYTEAPRIETERLVMRAFRAQDLEPLAAMWAEPAVVRFVGGEPLSREESWRRSLAACGQWPVVGWGYLVAELKSSGKAVGLVGFGDFKREMEPNIEGEPELGYVFSPSVHGQGIAFEACKAVLEWADANLGAACYPAIISPENTASVRLAEKLGFVRGPDATYRGASIGLFRRPRL